MSHLKRFIMAEFEKVDMVSVDADGKYNDAHDPQVKRTVNAAEKIADIITDMELSDMEIVTLTRLIPRLLCEKPLKPLTGEMDEWISSPTEAEPNREQNKRCTSVFKNGGIAYDTQAKIFISPQIGPFVGQESAARITFPYLPVSEYVKIPVLPKVPS